MLANSFELRDFLDALPTDDPWRRRMEMRLRKIDRYRTAADRLEMVSENGDTCPEQALDDIKGWLRRENAADYRVAAAEIQHKKTTRREARRQQRETQRNQKRRQRELAEAEYQNRLSAIRATSLLERARAVDARVTNQKHERDMLRQTAEAHRTKRERAKAAELQVFRERLRARRVEK